MYEINSVIPVCKEKNDDFMNKNSFDDYISSSLYNDDLEKEELMTETILILNERSTDNLNSKEKVQEEEKCTKGLFLKDLPKHLKYAFLGERRSKHVILAADLTVEKEQKVVEIIRKHKETIAWSVEDLKGISPSIYMHKILMEENARTSIKHKRRLNPIMKEVVKKEVLKWLNTGFIYAISDNPWVSLVHVVPKKGRMTMIRNEKTELIPIRSMTRWRVCIDYRKLNTATRKDHYPLPFIN